MDISAADIAASSITVGNGGVLDIQYAGTLEIAGSAGDVVFNADDGSTVNLYIDKNGSTSYVATVYNTYMRIGAATLNVDTQLRGSALPTSMTVFSTQDVGQTIYDANKIAVTDTLLGRDYVVDAEASTAEKLILKLQNSPLLIPERPTTNEPSEAILTASESTTTTARIRIPEQYRK